VNSEQRWPAAALAVAGLLFLLLATASSGGYRFGVSDQAFHVPAVVHALTPAAFPRDGALLDAQARFMLLPYAVAAFIRLTGLSIETAFFLGYLLTTALLWVGLVLLARMFSASPWSLVLLGALVALRHRIPRTTANSIEPYFYPRTLAFAFGVLAIVAFLHRRRWLAMVMTAIATLVHVTTGAWFVVLIGIAWARLDAAVRRAIAAGAGLALIAAAWGTISGQLSPFITPMDDDWVGVLAGNDSLFPSQWPVWAWAANLALPVVLVAIHRARVRRGRSRVDDEALIWGALGLVAVFAVTLPLVAWRWMLPTQLQISRVFWLVDFLVVVYAVALVSDFATARRAPGALRAIALAVLALVAVRAAFVMRHEHTERALFQVALPPSDWVDAMHWLGAQPLDVHVLADPGHALLYGSSVRVAAHRDVVLENIKDTAVALYARDVAMRVRERRASIGDDFSHLSLRRAESLARQYDLDYLVTAGDALALPVAYQNATFRIYDLRHRPESESTTEPSTLRTLEP
jgi:hypothetical protein